jgi:voltage-gated potassium channel
VPPHKRIVPIRSVVVPPPPMAQQRPLVRSAVLVAVVFAIGQVGFYLLGQPEADLVDAFYMTSITLTTIGYGEVVPVETTAAKLFTSLYAIAGFGMFVYLFSNVTAFMVEGGLDRYFWDRKMQRTIEKLKDHTVVCGAGNTGRHIIAELLEIGRPFVVIDRNPEVVRALHQQLGVGFPAVIGDATDDDVLRVAGVPRATGLIACISNDNDNLVITLSARILAPKLRIVARCVDEREQTKIRRAGADAVVLPNMIGGMRMVSEMIRPDVVTFLDEMVRDKQRRLRVEEVLLPEHSPLVGTTVGLLHARKIKDLLVVALRQADGTWHMRPRIRPLPLVLCSCPACQSPQADTSPFTTTVPVLTSEPVDQRPDEHGHHERRSSGSSSEASTTTGELSTTLDRQRERLDDADPGCRLRHRPRRRQTDRLQGQDRLPLRDLALRRHGRVPEQLLDAFPKFIDTIEAKFSDFDYHIMVVDGGRMWGLDTCEAAVSDAVRGPGLPLRLHADDLRRDDGRGGRVPGGRIRVEQAVQDRRRASLHGQGSDEPQGHLRLRRPGRRQRHGGDRRGADDRGPAGAQRPGRLQRGLPPGGRAADGDAHRQHLRPGGDPVTSTRAPRHLDGGSAQGEARRPRVGRDAQHPRHDPRVPREDRTCQMVKMFPYHLIADRDELDYSPFFDEATDLGGDRLRRVHPARIATGRARVVSRR